MSLTFNTNETLEACEALNLLRRSHTGLPDDDAHRLVRIVPQANLIITARDGHTLVGLARGLHERGACYLSDLIVDADYRDQELGEQLINHVRDAAGDKGVVVLVPAGAANFEASET